MFSCISAFLVVLSSGPFVFQLLTVLMVYFGVSSSFPSPSLSLLLVCPCCSACPRLCFVLNMKEIWTFKITCSSFFRDMNHKALSILFHFKKMIELSKKNISSVFNVLLPKNLKLFIVVKNL